MIPRFRPGYSWGQVFAQALGSSSQLALSELESHFAKRVGAAFCVWFPYGRVAVQAYLEALGKSGGVVLAAFNCLALGSGIRAAGWKPCYVDTGEGFNQDPEIFLKLLAQQDAGIVVSQWGIPSDSRIEREAKGPLLYDFALRGWETRLPSLRERDAVLFSLGWGKPGGTLRGGILALQNGAFAEALRAWRDRRLEPSHPGREALDLSLLKTAFQPLSFGTFWRLAHRVPAARRLSGLESDGGAVLPKDAYSRLSERLLALSWSRIEEGSPAALERREQLQRYAQLLRGISDRVQLPIQEIPLSHYPIRLENRDDVQKRLLARGIFSSSQLFSRLLCDYDGLKDENGASLPRSRELTRQTLHLPLYSGLDGGTQAKIATALTGILKENGR
jgi:dTDP-4-amino-4,6-dideoxygalactose transaminase